MGHHSYEKSKSIVLRVIIILGLITIIEVLIALLGKGHLIEGFYLPVALTGIVMIALSLTKAYYIVDEFMHMRYEVPAFVKTVLLPTLLLVWAVIAFFYEGNDWQKRRDLIKDKDREKVEKRAKADTSDQIGLLEYNWPNAVNRKI